MAAIEFQWGQSMKRHTISIKTQTFALFLVTVLPLMVVVLLFNIYTVRRSNMRVYENGLTTLELYSSTLETTLHNIENLMISLTASDPNYTRMRFAEEPYERLSDIYNVTNRYREFMNTYPAIGAMHLYARENATHRTVYQRDYTYAFKQQLDGMMDEILNAEENYTRRGWFYAEIDGRQMLLRVLGKDGLFTVCMIEPEMLPVPQAGTDAASSVLLYTTGDGKPTMYADFVREAGFEFRPDADSFYITGGGKRYLVSSSASAYGATGLFYLQPYSGMLGHLDLVQSLLLAASVALCILTIVALMLINRMNLRPMTRLIQTMTRIREGQKDARMDENYHVSEYRALSATFNGLIEEIQQLKIESYEKEISEQKARLLLLQSQIRPHFYLNCLKNVYALAEQKQFEKIQTLVLELSAYLRYMFQAPASMVTLGAELQSVEHYIELQRLTTFPPPQCVISAPETLLSIEMPPLSLLTFVENAVKHADRQGRALEVRIKATLLESEEGRYLNLTVTDNGKGFPDAVLRELNQPLPQFAEGHIGIQNVMRRFALIYGNRSTFSFSNLGDGSCIEIFIPLSPGISKPETETEAGTV